MRKKRMTGTASALVAVFVIAGILVLVLGIRQVYRLTTDPAWVASSDLEAGHVIEPSNLRLARSGDSGGIDDPRALIGKALSVDKDKGEVFRASDLTTPPKGWLAAMVPEGRVLYTLVPKPGTIPPTQIRNGDALDVLVRGAGGVRTVARNALLMGTLGGNGGSKPQAKGRGLLTALATAPSASNNKSKPQGTPLVLAVLPQHVYPLASIGASEEVSLVMHGEKEVDSGKLLSVTPRPTLRSVEVVNGLDRTQAVVKRD